MARNRGTQKGAQRHAEGMHGSTSLTLTNINITGTNASDFNRTTTCSLSTPLAAGASCTITVSFKPSATGSRSAAINVFDNGGGSPQVVPLSGTGI